MIGECYLCGEESKFACDAMDCDREMCAEHARDEFGDGPPVKPQCYAHCLVHHKERVARERAVSEGSPQPDS